MITFACSGCGKKLQAPEERAGQKARCPQCGQATPVPSSVTAGPSGPGKLSGPTLVTPMDEDIPTVEPLPDATQGQETATLPPPALQAAVPASTAFAVPGYEILQELGRGGMGVVFKARQLRLKRLVAIKMILAGELAGAAALARFRAEAEASARLSHPNIVQVHEAGEYLGRPYLTLEYVEGGNLAEHLAKHELPPRRAAGLIAQLARAVDFAHRKGIVHRDLKPANVLLAPNPDGGGWVPKIADFGLAKQLDDMAALATGLRTQSGAILGTPSYMAPEQASGKSKGVGPAADVWALGAILYECLTGRPPFSGESTLDTLIQVASGEPELPRRLRPACPPELEAVCLKCLRKEPKDRYESAGALADDLQRYLDGEPTEARPRQPREGLWGRLRRQRKRTYAAGGALVLVCVALLLVLLRSSPEEATADDTASQEKAVRRVRILARRQQSQNNLKQLAIAMQNLHDEWKYMPPAALCDPKTGKPLLSWRVAVLPYIEQDPLYKQFRLNEPWDSPHNITLLQHMPKVFAVEGSKARPGYTHYQVFVGPGTPFDTRNASLGGPFGRQGPRLPASFPDGTSQTILIAEAADAVPWTKPQDIDYDPKRPLPELGIVPGGFNAVMADRHTVFLRKNISERTLRAAITANDREVLGNDWQDDTERVEDEDLAPPPDKPRATVSGKVTFHGQPLTAGQVMFHNSTGEIFAAAIQADGSYTLAQAVPTGKYWITVTSGPGGGLRMILPVKYADRKMTPLSCTLRRGANDCNLELVN